MTTEARAAVHAGETDTLLSFLAEQRAGIRRTVRGLSQEQAETTPSASALSLAGLIKHLAWGEQSWIARAKGEEPAVAMELENWADCFRLTGGETLEGQLKYWEEVAAETERFFRSRGSLDETFPVPDRPWFPPEGHASLRWLGLHLLREFAQHNGHADIVRESLDGKTAYEL